MGDMNKKRKFNTINDNTTLNLFCINNTLEEIDEIENQFNKQFEEDEDVKKYVLNNLQLDKIEFEFERKYNIKYNLQI
jgi:hypothetical protein